MTIPTMVDTVNVIGEVLNQNTFVYDPKLSVDDYLEKARGLNQSADDEHIYIVKANGEAYRYKKNFFSTNKEIFKPTLYLLSVGISNYENPEYNLGVAHKDAQAITNLFKKQEGKIYKKVVSKTLINENATSGNILDGLDWIDKEATSKDVVIVFIAGHGVNDSKGNYYFVSHDTNTQKLRRTAVKLIELQDTISNLPSKIILLADTCHSGNIGGKKKDITSAIKSITNSGNGAIILTASTGNGYSYERKSWGHGAFTKAILDGIGDLKADFNDDEMITIKEIDLYVTSRVKDLTDGKQKPTTIIPQSVPNFAIGVQ